MTHHPTEAQKAAEKERLETFVACISDGKICVKWFADIGDAAIFYQAAHQSNATRISFSRLVTREEGRAIIHKHWPKMPVVETEGR